MTVYENKVEISKINSESNLTFRLVSESEDYVIVELVGNLVIKVEDLQYLLDNFKLSLASRDFAMLVFKKEWGKEGIKKEKVTLHSNERCSGRTTINVVQIIAKAMKEGFALVTDHYSPTKTDKYKNIKNNVLPNIFETIKNIGLEGFSVKSDSVNGIFTLVFKNP